MTNYKPFDLAAAKRGEAVVTHDTRQEEPDENDFEDIREDRGDAYYRIGWKCKLCGTYSRWLLTVPHKRGCKYAKTENAPPEQKPL